MMRARGAIGAAALAFLCAAAPAKGREQRLQHRPSSHGLARPPHAVSARAAHVRSFAPQAEVGSSRLPASRTAPPDDVALELALMESAAPIDDEPEPPRVVTRIKGRAALLSRAAPRKVRPVRAVPPNATWLAYRRAPWRRGYATLAGHGKQWSGFLVGTDGEVLPAARQALSSTLCSWRTGKQVTIDDRLIQLIADVSDEFGGRTIRIVSGYRETSFAPDSKHKVGEAFDFSIPGVPNQILKDFLRSLPDVGVGYYPNSTHVHLDVREKPTYWVDYSRPGQAPLYSYDRRVAVLTAAERAERALAAALEEILQRTLEHDGTVSPRAERPEPANTAHGEGPAGGAQGTPEDDEREAEPDGAPGSAASATR